MFFSRKPSKDQFAFQLIRVIADQFGIEFAYNQERFSLHQANGEAEMNLANLYTEHCQMPKADRPGHLEILASIFGQKNDELPEKYSEVRDHLRPKIWLRSMFEFQALDARLKSGKALDLPNVSIGTHLIASIVYDTEHAMRSLSAEEFEKWGVSVDEAMEHAIANLEQATMAFAMLGDHFASSMTGDAYDSSRILLAKRIEAMKLAGEPIAIVPNRDSFLVAGSDDNESLDLLFKLSKPDDGESEHRPLCPLPMIFRDGQWTDWAPSKNHTLRRQFDLRELQYLGELYTEQKRVLDQNLEAGLVDDVAFVASFSAVIREGEDQPISYAVWGEGVETLLPKTNYIALQGKETASGEWDHVMDVVGDLVEEDLSYYPTRYRVKEYPSDKQIREIGNALV